jgi:hypothetical protein
MDWQAIAQIVNSVGLLIVAVWSTYLTYSARSETFEEILYRKRIDAITDIYDLIYRLERHGKKVARANRVMDKHDLGLEKWEGEGGSFGEMVKERDITGFPEEEENEVREELQTYPSASGGMAEVLREMSEELVRVTIFLPEEAVGMLHEVVNEGNRVVDGKESVEDLRELRASFAAYARRVLGSSELGQSLKGHWT